MFFNKKIKQQGNLRRRFHHTLISKRKLSGSLPTQIPRHRLKIRRAWFFSNSPGVALLRKFLIFIIAGGIIIGLFYVLFFSSFFLVTRVSIEKNGNSVANSAIEPFLEKLKGKNVIFLNTDSLQNELEQTFRNEILLVKIRKSYPHQLIVKIDEYPPILNLKVRLDNQTQKFVVNQIGYAIFENTEIKTIPTLTLQTNKSMKAKTVVIDPAKLNPIAASFKKFTEIFGIKVTEGKWLKIERELHLKTEKNFEVWLDLTDDVEKQLDKLKRALPKLDIYKEPIEYIDLRISGGESEKVIFKRRK